jgi:hypothetical protein
MDPHEQVACRGRQDRCSRRTAKIELRFDPDRKNEQRHFDVESPGCGVEEIFRAPRHLQPWFECTAHRPSSHEVTSAISLA